MKSDAEKPKTNKTGACLRCGFETDQKMGESFFCEDCYYIRSSCCPEFGPDDISAPSCDNGKPGS